MIVLSYARTDPWAVMVVFPYAFPTFKAMLCPDFLFAMTDITVIVCVLNKLINLLLLVYYRRCAGFIAWIFANR